ncbi:MAG: hypothetical protein KIT69_12815, partial [Propionibacteriaceae bacterium]|nr:hypothetical protein [Propionibacteriaceae bacterium]
QKEKKNKLCDKVRLNFVKLLGEDWYKNNKLQNSLNNFNKLEQFYNQNNRLPLKNPKKKGENKIAVWFSEVKSSKRNQNSNKKIKQIIYPEVEQKLVELLGRDWYKEEDKLQNSMDKFNSLKQFYEQNKKIPTTCSKNKNEKQLGSWLFSMRKSKKNLVIEEIEINNKQKQNKKKYMTLYPEIEQKLIELLGNDWYKEENKLQNSLDKFIEFKQFYEQNKKIPSNSKNNPENIKLLNIWFTNMKQSKINKNSKQKIYPEVEQELIKLFNTEKWYEINNLNINQYINKPITLENNIKKITKTTKMIKRTPKISDIGIYHQKYKKMKSTTYFNYMQQTNNYEEWQDYHLVMDDNDLRCKIHPADFIAQLIKKKYDTFDKLYNNGYMIDLGCGTLKLKEYLIKQYNITSDENIIKKLTEIYTAVDVSCLNEHSNNVYLNDIIGLTINYPDWKNFYKIVIMCRAIFAINYEEQIKETSELLTDDGITIICEPIKLDEKNNNELEPILRKYYKTTTPISDETYTYFICKKTFDF